MESSVLKVGDLVRKVGGDYSFDGIVVAVFNKLSGKVRVVAEDDRGILHVFSEKNLERISNGHSNDCQKDCDCCTQGPI